MNSRRCARRLARRCEDEKEAAQAAYQEGRWTLNAVLERNTAKADERRRSAEKRLTSVLDRLVTIRREASVLWDQWEEGYLHPSWKSAAGPRDKNPRLGLRKSLAALEERLADLQKQLQELTLPKVLKGGRLTLFFAVLGVLAIYPMGLLVSLCGGPKDLLPMLVGGLVASSVATLAVGMTTKLVLEFVARRQVRSLFHVYPGFCRAVDSVALRCRQRLKSAGVPLPPANHGPEKATPPRPKHARGAGAAGVDGGQEAARRGRAGGAGGLPGQEGGGRAAAGERLALAGPRTRTAAGRGQRTTTPRWKN